MTVIFLTQSRIFQGNSINLVRVSEIAGLPTAFLFQDHWTCIVGMQIFWWFGLKTTFFFLFFSFGAGETHLIFVACVWACSLLNSWSFFSSNHFSAVNQHNWFRKTPSVDWINKSLVSWKFNRSQSLTKSIFLLINSTMEYFLMSHDKTALNK